MSNIGAQPQTCVNGKMALDTNQRFLRQKFNDVLVREPLPTGSLYTSSNLFSTERFTGISSWYLIGIDYTSSRK